MWLVEPPGQLACTGANLLSGLRPKGCNDGEGLSQTLRTDPKGSALIRGYVCVAFRGLHFAPVLHGPKWGVPAEQHVQRGAIRSCHRPAMFQLHSHCSNRPEKYDLVSMWESPQIGGFPEIRFMFSPTPHFQEGTTKPPKVESVAGAAADMKTTAGKREMRSQSHLTHLRARIEPSHGPEFDYIIRSKHSESLLGGNSFWGTPNKEETLWFNKDVESPFGTLVQSCFAMKGCKDHVPGCHTKRLQPRCKEVN